jgi:hypothetical protein
METVMETIDIGGGEDLTERLDAIEAQQLVIIERLEDISEKLSNLSLPGEDYSIEEL